MAHIRLDKSDESSITVFSVSITNLPTLQTSSFLSVVLRTLDNFLLTQTKFQIW